MPYDPQSDDVLRTVADELVSSLNESFDRNRWCRDNDAAFADVVPPHIRTEDVSHRCREDWHGGDPNPAIEKLVTGLHAAGAIRRLRSEAVDVLEGFDDRWAALHGQERTPTGSDAGLWEIADRQLFERVLFSLAGNRRTVNSATRSEIQRFLP